MEQHLKLPELTPTSGRILCGERSRMLICLKGPRFGAYAWVEHAIALQSYSVPSAPDSTEHDPARQKARGAVHTFGQSHLFEAGVQRRSGSRSTEFASFWFHYPLIGSPENTMLCQPDFGFIDINRKLFLACFPINGLSGMTVSCGKDAIGVGRAGAYV